MRVPDKYASFALLAEAETEGTDYRIHTAPQPSPIVIIAPHGGAIEPGTSEIAAAIARNSIRSIVSRVSNPIDLTLIFTSRQSDSTNLAASAWLRVPKLRWPFTAAATETTQSLYG